MRMAESVTKLSDSAAQLAETGPQPSETARITPAVQAYEQYFGFERPMFQDLLAHDDAVFHTDQSEALTHQLAVALTRREAVAVISGLSGTGKTTLALDCVSRTSTRLASTCISQSLQNPDELLEQLLSDFGHEPRDLSRVERLQLWRQFLAEMAATDSRVCVIVENCEHVDGSILRALHELTIPHAPQFPGANIILTTALPDASTDTPALNQRIRLRARIDPLTADQIDDYIAFKCGYAEVDRDQIVTGEIAGQLHELSGGVIRVLDSILETGLVLAAEAKESPLSPATIAALVSDRYALEPMSPVALNQLLENSTPGSDTQADFSDIRAVATGTDTAIPTLTDYIPAANGIPMSQA